jgi:hypothetical protein
VRFLRLPLLASFALSLCAAPSLAESHNPADYPLRVHIYKVTNHRHRYRTIQWIEGEGNANLYEGGVPAAVDFAYTCGERFMHSDDFETLPAKWKKPGYSLIILTHEIGSDSPRTCEFKVDVKDFAYARVNGHITTEPAADLQHWMIEHHYDPEHSTVTPSGLPYNSQAHP